MSAELYSGTALKRNAWHFLTGRAVSAVLTFVILLWLVRLLPIVEYSAYVTLVATLELALGISALGLPWMAARYLPEYRLHAPGRILIGFTKRLLLLLFGSLVLAALLSWANLRWLLALLDMPQYEDVARLYLLILIVEGFGRHLRESALGPLMMQGMAQISLVLRNLVMLLLLVFFSVTGLVSLHDVVMAELLAAISSAVLAGGGLVRYLKLHRTAVGTVGWSKPAWQVMSRTARHMYLSQLIALSYSPQVLLVLIRHHLGVEATAVFGFLRSLYEQASRYLPATLLFSLIRPKLVASYVGRGGIEELARNANLAGKLSLFVLMPLVVFVAVRGEELVSLLAGGKFPDTGYYLLGLLLALIPFSQRQIVETVAVTSGHSRLCTYSAALGLVILPLTYVFLEAGLGLWAPIIGLGIGNLMFNGFILVGMGRITAYRADMLGFTKLMLASLVAYLAISFLPVPREGWTGLLTAVAAVLITYLAAAYLIKPFAQLERDTLNRLVAHGLFVW